MSTTNTGYREARDLLLKLRQDYDAAVRQYRDPSFGATFNWATDWFDAIAADNQRTALWLVEQDGSEHRYSFAEMARRSDQVAGWLSGLGVGKGDPVLLMLGNQVELWESMLAVMKLGAVIMPATSPARQSMSSRRSADASAARSPSRTSNTKIA